LSNLHLYCFVSQAADVYAQGIESNIVHSDYVPEGYELFHNDEFNSTTLDLTKWYPSYLPHWSDAAHIDYAIARYEMSNGTLKLKTLSYEGISHKEQFWSPFNTHINSGIMSGQFSGPRGSQVGLHKERICSSAEDINKTCSVYGAHKNQFQKMAVTKYGYFEIRAKICPAGNCAWWMIGFEDDATKSGEIDILEIDHYNSSQKCAHFGTHAWNDPNLQDESKSYACPNSQEWHTYGFLWTPTTISLHIDGKHKSTLNQSPNYEMLTIFSASNGDGNSNLPSNVRNQFEIDYFRIYKETGIKNIIPSMIGGKVGWGHKANRAVDGSTGTYAQSDTEKWDLKIDLNKLHMVDKIVYKPNGTNWAKKYQIQVRHEDGNWTTIKNVTNSTNAVQTHIFNPPEVARYIRLRVTRENSAGDIPHAINEFEVHGIPNLVEDQDIEMKRGNPGWGNVISRSVDGRLSTYTQSEKENWNLFATLTDEATIERIIYRPNSANWAKNYTIQVRREGKYRWETVRTVTNSSGGDKEFVFDPPIKARYIRLNVTRENSTGDFAHAINEFEVYGLPE